IVEHPRQSSDEFALVSPSSAARYDSISVLVKASRASVMAYVDNGPGASNDRSRSAFMGSESQPNEQKAQTLAMFSVATVFLLLASLVAAAGFAVVAQRRLRQLGMLSAVGGPPAEPRPLALTNPAPLCTIAAP